MEQHRLLMVVLLALLSVHMIQGTSYQDEDTNPTDDTPVSVFIPLSDSFNMTTRWLGNLRDSYIRIIGYERDQRIQAVKVMLSNVQEMSQSYRSEMDDLVMSSAEKDSECVDKKKEPVLQVLSTLEAELQGCVKPAESMTSDYEQQLEEILMRVTAQDEASIYTPCLPDTETLTTSILRRAEKCFQSRYQESVDSFYFSTGHQLFTAVTEAKRRAVTTQLSVQQCADAVIQAHEEMLHEKLEGLRGCGTAHRRSRRGFGKKLRKAWKKVKNGVKKLCNRVPCRVGYSVPLPGK